MHIDSNACSVMHGLSLTCFRLGTEYWFWWSKESSLWISLDCIMYVKTYRRSGLFSIKYPDSNYDSGRNHLSGFLWITFSNNNLFCFALFFIHTTTIARDDKMWIYPHCKLWIYPHLNCGYIFILNLWIYLHLKLWIYLK